VAPDAGDAGTGGGSGGGTFGAPICANDPCDPSCTEVDAPDADLTPDAMTATTTTTVTTTVVAYQGSANGFGGTPAGFHSKEVNPAGCVSGGVVDYSQCNTDYHCDTASGQCVRSAPGWSYPAAVCAGIKLTISGACTDSNGNTTMPLCNRGNTTLFAANYPLGVSYYLVNGNQFDFNCPTYAPSGYLPLTQDLAPGQCVNVWPPGVHGNTIMYINADHSIPECGAFGGANKAPGCYENWADVKSGGSCQGQTTTAQTTVNVPAYAKTVYSAPTTTAQCPPATMPEWSVFTYDVVLPTNASGSGNVLIEAQVAPVMAGNTGAFGPWKTFANTAPPTSDPAVCPFVGGVGGCPKNAFTLLGGLPAATYAALNLRMTLTPTPDGQAMPVVVGWQVAYSCVASE
jgi:hypothetical protein